MGVIAILLLPPLLMLFLYATPLVTLILGPKWIPSIPVMLWLTAAGYVQAINSVMFPAHLAVRKTRYSAIIMIFYVIIMVSLLVPMAIQGGLAGAGIAMFLARVCVQPTFLFSFPKIFKKEGCG